MAQIPPGAKTVQVKDALTAKIKYKPIDEVQELDEVQFTKDGIPIVMRKLGGRPKAVVIAPVTPLAAESVKQKLDALAADPILRIAKANPDDPDVLQQVILALGNEVASIGWERQQAELQGDKTSDLSVRRVNALKALADTWLKRKLQITTQGVDMNSPAYRVFMGEVLKAFRMACSESGIRDELRETIFTKMDKIMNDTWEADVKSRMKNMA